MNGSSIKSGSVASLALRLARGALWSALMGAAVLGVLLAAALLTRQAVADEWRPSPPAAYALDGENAPGARASLASAWAPDIHVASEP